jgi:putative Holliday junction resolvase
MIIAFDYGTKNIGVAATDESEIFSFAKCSIPTTEYEMNPSIIADRVPQILEANLIIVGHPKNLKNLSTPSTVNAEKFAEELKKLFPATTILLYDERFTSKIALNNSHSSRPKTKKKTLQDRANKDMIEAQILLQEYLKRRENEI